MCTPYGDCSAHICGLGMHMSMPSLDLTCTRACRVWTWHVLSLRASIIKNRLGSSTSDAMLFTAAHRIQLFYSHSTWRSVACNTRYMQLEHEQSSRVAWRRQRVAWRLGGGGGA